MRVLRDEIYIFMTRNCVKLLIASCTITSLQSVMSYESIRIIRLNENEREDESIDVPNTIRNAVRFSRSHTSDDAVMLSLLLR